MSSEFRQYRRKQIAELREWEVGDEMAGVSVSAEDAKAGSPKAGDMIARNPANHADQWLVAKKYFEDNFAALAAQPADKLVCHCKEPGCVCNHDPAQGCHPGRRDWCVLCFPPAQEVKP